MARFADLSEILNNGTGGGLGAPQQIHFMKYNTGFTPVAHKPYSLWMVPGVPASRDDGYPWMMPPEIPTAATPNGLRQTNPGGGRQKWILGAGAVSDQQGTLVIYDRLLHMAALFGDDTNPQTVGGTITRYTNGVGNIAWAEIYSAVGATPTTITMSYTDPVNGAGRTSTATAFGGTGNREEARAVMLPVAAGDTGIAAVASVTLAASTGASGDFGITIAHPLLQITMPYSAVRDTLAGLPQMPEVKTDACLSMLWIPQTAVIPEITGYVSLMEA